MSEVHTTISGAHQEATVVFHNPSQHPLPGSAGKAVANVSVGGKVVSTHGSLQAASSVQNIIDNPNLG